MKMLQNLMRAKPHYPNRARFFLPEPDETLLSEPDKPSSSGLLLRRRINRLFKHNDKAAGKGLML